MTHAEADMHEEESLCECHYCETEIDWDDRDDAKGMIWYCQECGVDFCTECFVSQTNEKLVAVHEEILCPDCFFIKL